MTMRPEHDPTTASPVSSAAPSCGPDGGGNLRVLLVDDEPPARERLRRLLDRIGAVTVVGEVATGSAALTAIERLEPDVVLLDINLPDLDGLRVLEALDDPPAVIFCTAYSEHAVRAFDLEAVDYLLKPFSAERLRRALQRTRRFLTPLPSSSPAGEGGGEAGEGARSGPELRRVPALEGLSTVLVPVERIIAIRVEEGVTFLLRDDGERLICDEPVRELEASLPERLFFRANRQALINLEAVQSFEPTPEGGLRVRLRTGVTEQVSRRRVRHFRNRIRAGPPGYS